MLQAAAPAHAADPQIPFSVDYDNDITIKSQACINMQVWRKDADHWAVHETALHWLPCTISCGRADYPGCARNLFCACRDKEQQEGGCSHQRPYLVILEMLRILGIRVPGILRCLEFHRPRQSDD